MTHAPGENRQKILIADTHPENIRVAQKTAEEWGIEVDVVSTGLAVLGYVRKNIYMLIFMSTELPEMSGIKATRVLRVDTRYQTLPIIGCLSESSKDAPTLLLRDGFNVILTTPLSSEMLEAELRRLLPTLVFRKQPVADSGEIRATQTLPVSVPTGSTASAPVVPAKSTDIAEELASLPGFDCAKGVHRVMGNLDLYVKLLVNFKQALLSSQSEMIAAQEEGIDAVRALVHKLKGISGNLGADRLFAQTLELEALLKQQELSSSQGELDFFMASVQESLGHLDSLSFLSSQPTLLATHRQDTAVHAEAKAIMEKEMFAALEETLSLLRQCDTAAREAFDRFVSFFDTSRDQELEGIKEAIDSFNFEHAEKSLTTFARTLGPKAEALL